MNEPATTSKEPSPFCNNLNKGDRVEHAVDKKRGTVHCQPRESSTKPIILWDGRALGSPVHIGLLRLVIDGKVAEDVPPCNGLFKATKAVRSKPVETTEGVGDRLKGPINPEEVQERDILKQGGATATPSFESTAKPIKMLDSAQITGVHMKHYMINYMNKSGQVFVNKTAAQGIVQAITLFYMQHEETAIISVMCIL